MDGASFKRDGDRRRRMASEAGTELRVSCCTATIKRADKCVGLTNFIMFAESRRRRFGGVGGTIVCDVGRSAVLFPRCVWTCVLRRCDDTPAMLSACRCEFVVAPAWSLVCFHFQSIFSCPFTANQLSLFLHVLELWPELHNGRM